jgi:hypothetical protein
VSKSVILLRGRFALGSTSAEEIIALTEAATAAFGAEGLSEEQRAANRRVVDTSAGTCARAAAAPHQHFAAAFLDGDLGGYMIATRHQPQDLDPLTATGHAVPHWVMRREPGADLDGSS